MSYFSGIFTTQYHKSRAGYFLNHDVLNQVSPQARNKLIFYFIAEQVPEKLVAQDRETYLNQRYASLFQRNSRVANPITLWTYASFLSIFIPAALYVAKRKRLSSVRDLLIWGAVAGYSATVVNSVLWRTYEGRWLDSSPVLDKLASKYNFGIFDFSLAKKESHVRKMLEVYDSKRQNLHDQL